MALVYNAETNTWEEQEMLGDPQPTAITPQYPQNEPLWTTIWKAMQVQGAPGGIKPDDPLAPWQLKLEQERQQKIRDAREPQETRFLADNYSQMMNAGVTKITLGDSSAGMPQADIRIKNPAIEQQKKVKRDQEAQQPQQPTWSGAAQPTGPMETPLQPGRSAAGPATPGGGFVSPEQRAREEAAKIQYASRFGGEVPMSIGEYAAQKKAILEKELQKKLHIIREAYPTRGELLAEGYKRIGANMSKPMRAFMSFLNLNPFWTDTQAAAEAEYEATRQAAIGKERLSAWDAHYRGLMSLLDKQEQLETTKKSQVLTELGERLKTEPGLIYSRIAAKDYAMSIGIPAKEVKQFLDDHFDAKTGKYNLLKNPYEEKTIVIKNLANQLQTLLPGMQDEMYIVGAQYPQVLMEWATDKAKKLNAMALYEKDQKKKEKLQLQADAATSMANNISQRPEWRRYIGLLSIRQDPAQWDRMSVPEKQMFWKRYMASAEEVWGPDPEKDPERRYLKDMESAARYKGILLDNEIKAQAVKTAKDKEEQPVDIFTSSLRATDPLYSQKKVTAKQLEEGFNRQNEVIVLMSENKIPTGKDAVSREFQRQAQAIRTEVTKYIPAVDKERYKDLTDAEITVLANAIYGAQSSGQLPNMTVILRFLDRQREARTSKKK